MVGPDHKIYLGTHEGPDPEDSGQILVFDPKHPEKAIQVVGKPSPTETYLWMFTLGQDGKIYGCTYPNAKLVSYDLASGAMADLGRMDEEQKYTRQICTGPDGKIYLGIGYGQANVVVYDPKTGEHHSILPDEYRKDPKQTAASVYLGIDGQVYATATAVEGASGETKTKPVTQVVREGALVVSEKPAPPVVNTTLKDGRIAGNPTLNGTYSLTFPNGKVEERTFTYQGDGAGLFMVATGPLGRIYGGTYMPNEIFWYDPATGQMENPGNPSETGGEIYSMLDHHGLLYTCSYPGSFLSKWDPGKPFHYGRAPEDNPRGFGPLGPGHLRPRAMIHGPGEKIFIGSYPEYGLHGGSLGVWDPVEDKLIENYHPLVKNQAVVSLVYDPETELVFGGTSTEGGGGTNPIEPEAKFFAFNPKTKGLVLEDATFPGEQSIRSMVRVGRRIFGIAGGANKRIFKLGGSGKLFVYDIDSKTYLNKSDLGLGAVLDCSLGLWKDGKLYGLTGNTVFRLDPGTYQAEVLAKYDGEIRCGFAMDDHGIYFGDRATLMRYSWAP
jgi:hypothetical protein